MSKKLATIMNSQPNSTYIVLAHNEQIGTGWAKWVDVTEYRTAYLYFDTTSGAPDFSLAILFDSSSSRVLPYGIGSPKTILVQIGASLSDVVKIDIQGDIMEFGMSSMSGGDHIITSISLYLVT
jgi:hypothetical protein